MDSVEGKTERYASRKRNVVVSISESLYKYAKDEHLTLSAILELALLRHYRQHVDRNFMTRYGYYLIARCKAREPEMLRLEMFFRDLGVYCY